MPRHAIFLSHPVFSVQSSCNILKSQPESCPIACPPPPNLSLLVGDGTRIEAETFYTHSVFFATNLQPPPALPRLIQATPEHGDKIFPQP